MKLEAEEIMNLKVICSQVCEVNHTPDGILRVIPIVGGIFLGKLEGSILGHGSDWNMERQGSCAYASAKYLLKTTDGEFIVIENQGLLDHTDDAFIKTTPRFYANENGKYGWLNHGVYVGSLNMGKEPYAVEITIYRMV